MACGAWSSEKTKRTLGLFAFAEIPVARAKTARIRIIVFFIGWLVVERSNMWITNERLSKKRGNQKYERRRPPKRRLSGYAFLKGQLLAQKFRLTIFFLCFLAFFYVFAAEDSFQIFFSGFRAPVNFSLFLGHHWNVGFVLVMNSQFIEFGV